MLSKYSKIAVAAAIAGTCGYASAATLLVNSGSTGATFSNEGAVQNGATNNFDAKVAVTFDKNLRTGDEIRFTLTRGRFESLAAGVVSVSCATNGLTISSNRVSTSAAEITLGVTGTSAGETTAGTTCTFASLAVAVDSFTSVGNVTMGGGVFDAASNSYDPFTSTATGNIVASAGSQYVSISVTSALNGVVDFQDSLGYGFAESDGARTGLGNTDQLTLTVTSRDTANSFAGTASVQFALAAESGKSFAFLCTGNPSNVLNSSGATARYASGSGADVTVNSGCTSLSVTDDVTAAANTVNIGFGSTQATPSVGVTIDPMTFPAAIATLKIGATTVATSASLTLGSWTSNGSTVQIPYMPINTTAGAGKIDPVIIISNRSNAIGTISATVRDEDGNTCAISDSVLGTIAAQRTKSVGGAIRDAIAGSTCSTLGSVEKVAVTLTVTLPSGSTEVYSGYTVGGDSRVTVVNSSNGR